MIALNAGVLFTLDVNQCNFSCMYCIANLDLLSLFLLVDLLSGFALISETLTMFFDVCTRSPVLLTPPSIDGLSGWALALVIQTRSPWFRSGKRFFLGGVKRAFPVVRYSNAAWRVPGKGDELLCADHGLF